MVACLCAAWCGTCTEYRPRFEALARARTDALFVWIDIEDHPEYLGDEDVEDFPTVVVQRHGQTCFFGPLLPHIGHLDRLLDALHDNAPTVNAGTLPDLGALLMARQSVT